MGSLESKYPNSTGKGSHETVNSLVHQPRRKRTKIEQSPLLFGREISEIGFWLEFPLFSFMEKLSRRLGGMESLLRFGSVLFDALSYANQGFRHFFFVCLALSIWNGYVV